MPFSLHQCLCRSDLLNLSTVPWKRWCAVQLFVYFQVKNNVAYTISNAVM